MATYWEKAAHSAYDMFSWYKCLIVNLFFSHLGFWRGILFLIAPFPDRYLLVSFFLNLAGIFDIISWQWIILVEQVYQSVFLLFCRLQDKVSGCLLVVDSII